MIKVSVLYPKSNGSHFNMDYYCNKHIPMVQQKLGAACKGTAVEEGLGGGASGAEPSFVAMGHLYFDTVDTFQNAFGPHADAVLADIPNYTNITPTIQVSSVRI